MNNGPMHCNAEKIAKRAKPLSKIRRDADEKVQINN